MLKELLKLSKEPGMKDSEYKDDIEEMKRKLDLVKSRNSPLATYMNSMRKSFQK
jgi:hypothetical protein